jgi:MoaA/NifB/PqqE/SkfB family radical SAM enzyme
MNLDLLKSFWRNYFRFEHGYFTVGGALKDLSYFLRQGHLVAHIVDRIKFRIYPKLLLVPDFPTHVDIEPASACQMRCPMCYTTYMSDEKKGLMSFELFKKVVDQAYDGGAYSVRLSWRGESLLNDQFLEMVSYAKRKGIKEVAFLTNAERLTKNLIERLVDLEVDWISVSADGVGKVYEEIRAPAKFEETLEKIRYMKEYRDRNGKKKPLMRVQSVLSALSDNSTAYVSAWRGIVDRINFIADEKRDFEIREMAHDPFYVCPLPWQRITVAHDGKVHQCISDYAGYNIMGDANHQSLREIWHGEKFSALRVAFVKHTYLPNYEACRNCSDNVVTQERLIEIDGKRIKARQYVGISDVVVDNQVMIQMPEKLKRKIGRPVKRGV